MSAINQELAERPILLFGANGQVGWELRRTLAPLGAVIAVARKGGDRAVDFAQPQAVRELIDECRPSLIVNAAAYTAVDRAEEEAELAWQVNAEVPGVIAESARRVGAGVVHYSTDYVFAGDGDQPCREDDPVAPQGVYGRSKLAGEEAVVASGADHLILRTAWVYGMRGGNFLLTMLRLAAERERLGIVDDQTGSPTWCRMIAEATALMVRTPGALSELGGLYHLTNQGETTWYRFARAIFDRAPGPLAVREVSPITTADYPTPATRPAYSVLSGEKLADRFGLRLPDWEVGLDLCMGRNGDGEPV